MEAVPTVVTEDTRLVSPAEDTATRERIDDEATAWYLRLKDPGASDDDRHRFERWLARDSRHADAYERAAALWLRLEGPARALAAADDYRPPEPRRQARSRRHPWLVAACLLCLLTVGALLWRDPGLIDRTTADMATAPGISRTRTLADGTRLFLDFDSAVDIDLAGDTRRLALRRGRVWLDVAADGRPFVVTGGGARVRVTGTRFGVARQPRTVLVTVASGRVEVAGNRDAGTTRVLRAGDQVPVSRGRPGDVRDVNARVELAWARGLVLFDRARFASVAAQLERALPGRLIYDAESFRDIRLSGSFPADRPQALLDSLRRTYGVRTRRIPGAGLWLHR